MRKNIIIDLKRDREREIKFIRETNKIYKSLLNNLKGALPRYEQKEVKIKHILKDTLFFSCKLKQLISNLKTIPADSYKTIKEKYENTNNKGSKPTHKEINEIIKDIEGHLRNSDPNRHHVNFEELIDDATKIFDKYNDNIGKTSKLSQEIKDLLSEKNDLDKFFFYLNENKLFENDEYSRKQIKSLRRILNNPVLNAIPYWKSILTRGICDYIAGMTDQEALNEYEKLYAGVMELI